MSNSLLINPNISGAVVTAADSARLRRDDLVKIAGSVVTVTDRLDADDATAVLRNLKEFSREIESQRTAAKAPILELGRKIDAMGKELTASVDSEATRISRVLGTFEAEERRKAEQIRIEANNEAQRIAREAETAARLAARKESTPEAADRAADAIVETAAAKVVAVQQAAINAAPVRTEGTQVRGTVQFEVTDIAKLYAAYPLLVTLEPNGTAIRAIIRQNPNLQVPGLRHWIDHKLSV